MPPTNSHSGRGAYFRTLIHSRVATYALAFGCTGTFVLGASLHAPVMMVVLPATVVLFVLSAAAFLANATAAQKFFTSFADGLGLEYAVHWELPCFTPLLGAGNRQWCNHWMTGDIVKEPRLTGGLGYFFYERREHSGEVAGRGRVKEQGHFTICVVDIEPSMSVFKGIFLRQRRGLFETRSDWLADTPSKKVELESTAFTERYELRISDEQDELLVRELFSPSLVDWLAGHPLGTGFELRAGALVTFVPKLLQDGGNLTYLLDAAREIAGRVVREVQEEGRPQYLRYGST